MPVNIMWDDEAKTIIRSESTGKWSWEDYHEALDKMVEMMKTVNHRVDIINDRRPDSQRPAGSGNPHYQRAMRILPENTGLNVVVNTNTLARMVVSIFSRLYGSKARGQVTLAASLEDARAIIARDRAKTAAKS